MNSTDVIKRQSLGRKLLILVVLFSSLITLVISAIQLANNYKDDVANIHKTLKSIKEVHLDSLSSTVWTADIIETQRQLEGISRLPDISFIEIVEDDRTLVSIGTKRSEDVINETIDIIHVHRDQKLTIGTLRIQATLINAYDHLVDRAIDILISNAIKTFLVSAFILFLFYNLLTRHLQTIANFTKNLDLEHLETQLVLNRNNNSGAHDELEVLVNSINNMQHNLRNSLIQIKNKDKKYKQLIESSTAVPWELDLATFRFTYVGPQAERILGYPVNDWYEEDFWASHLHSEDKKEAIDFCQKSTAAGKDHSFEYRMIAQNQQEVWIRDDVQVVSKNGKPVKLQGYMFEITQRKLAEIELEKHRKHLEALVRERTAELEMSNEELEAFCYSVSHDLRSPLRSISGFAQIVREEIQDETSDENIDYIDRVVTGCKNMNELIDSLLNLSRVTRKSMSKDSVDLSRLAKEAFENEVETTLSHVKYDIQDHLIANGDYTLYKVLISNLVSNAVKYSSKTEHPYVEFGAKYLNGQLCYYMKDNGAGFNMEYASKLFSPFQRLHRKEHFEGTGVGLATVYRIVKRHNGRIWAEGKVNEGATIWFTLNDDKEIEIDEYQRFKQLKTGS